MLGREGGCDAMWRAIAAGISVVIAAAVGVVTVLATAHSSWGLWAALGALVVVGAVLQAAVAVSERHSVRRVAASGAGAVAVGGSAAEIRTRVQGTPVSPGALGTEDVTASSAGPEGITAYGPGSVGVGGDVKGPVSTDVTSANDESMP